jgi:ribosome biogenesis GTPase
LICISKIDLAAQVEDKIMLELGDIERIGYRILFTSAKTGEGIEELKVNLDDKLSVFNCKSGVEKTSLLNWSRTWSSGLRR